MRLGAHETWIAYRGVEAFGFALGWTVAVVFFVREPELDAVLPAPVD